MYLRRQSSEIYFLILQYGINEAGTIEVSNEQIAAGLPVLLQVRRGSESALNQLLPDAGKFQISLNDEKYPFQCVY